MNTYQTTKRGHEDIGVFLSRATEDVSRGSNEGKLKDFSGNDTKSISSSMCSCCKGPSNLLLGDRAEGRKRHAVLPEIVIQLLNRAATFNGNHVILSICVNNSVILTHVNHTFLCHSHVVWGVACPHNLDMFSCFASLGEDAQDLLLRGGFIVMGRDTRFCSSPVTPFLSAIFRLGHTRRNLCSGDVRHNLKPGYVR